MDKLVKLSLEGTIDYGYQVKLVEIQEEGKDGRILTEGVSGQLPPATHIYKNYQNWQQIYKHLELVFRGLKKSGQHKLQTEISVEDCQKLAEEIKKDFNEWLADKGFIRIQNTLRSKLNESDRIRILIKTSDWNLWQLPWSGWEFLEEHQNAAIALSPKESNKGDEKAIQTTRRKQVKILAVCGDETGIDYQLDRENLKRLRGVGAEPEFLSEPTPSEVRDRLWDKPWDVLFFAGHSDEKRLYLNKVGDYITHEELENTLKNAVQNGLKIALLNSCKGLEIARKMVTESNLPLVIAMREEVPNVVARQFLERFLLEYAYKKQPLYVAVRKAIGWIEEEWQQKFPCVNWLPVICQNPAYRPPLWSDLHRPVSLRQVGVASLACTSLVMLARFAGLLQPLELAAFDHLMRSRPDEGEDKRLLVVTLTESDSQQYGNPMSDLTVAQILENLLQHQPLAIGLDIIRKEERAPGTKQFTNLVEQNDSIVVICETGDIKQKNDPNKISISFLPGIQPKAVGFNSIALDGSDIVRRHLFAMTKRGETNCPAPYALSSELAFLYLYKKKGIIPQFLDEGLLQLGSILIKRLENHTGFYHTIDDGGHQTLLNYRSFQKIAKKISLTEVLENRLESADIKGRIVLIGDTTGKDSFATPYGSDLDQKMPGVLVHAQMVSQMISAVEDGRPLLWFWSGWGDFLWVGFWSAIGGVIVLLWREPLQQKLAGTAALVILWGVCFIVLLMQGGCLPLVPSALALVLTSGSLIIYTTSPASTSNFTKIQFWKRNDRV